MADSKTKTAPPPTWAQVAKALIAGGVAGGVCVPSRPAQPIWASLRSRARSPAAIQRVSPRPVPCRALAAPEGYTAALRRPLLWRRSDLLAPSPARSRTAVAPLERLKILQQVRAAIV